ncbi:probable G-protein coupled receptor 139 [Heterodontus francisci]|uniref:probable G-protein coupled receptor 139 n=1 Tax=Heterodontus francisci TaxID=7792 RepID=UPI00355C375F
MAVVRYQGDLPIWYGKRGLHDPGMERFDSGEVLIPVPLLLSRGLLNTAGHSEIFNLVAIVILSRGKCGLSNCTTRYLVAMAAADLLLVITNVILYRIIYYYFPTSFLNITPVSCVILTVSHIAGECSVWFTIMFSFDRFVAICCPKLKTKYCTEKTAAVVLGTTSMLFCLKNVPFYFTLGPGETIDNVPFFCFFKPNLYTEPGWMVYDRFSMVLTPLLPFALILLVNALTVRHIFVASRVRKGLRGQSKGENCSDPEMASRQKSVILLFAISGNFILLWLTYVICILYYTIQTVNPDDNDSTKIIRQVGIMLANLCCCTNTLLYGVSQSKFREQFKNTVKYPITSLIQIIKKQNN